MEPALNCFAIASSYVGARAMLNGVSITASGAVLNPAIAVGSNLTQLLEFGYYKFKWVWIYGGMPFVGALIAVLFHEFVFKKTEEALAETDEPPRQYSKIDNVVILD
jgi:glycerol uptake facilitator-like aquaporin